MFTTPRLRDSISIGLTKLLQRGRRGSHSIQVCKKGSRQSEQQRSDIQLRNLAFCVWEDASLWARCIHSFLMHFSYLGQSCFLVHLAPCILPTPHETGSAPDSWGAHARNEFSEPRGLHLPIHRMLNSLTWYLISDVQTACSLCCKFEYSLTCFLLAWSIFTRATEMLSTGLRVLNMSTK